MVETLTVKAKAQADNLGFPGAMPNLVSRAGVEPATY